MEKPIQEFQTEKGTLKVFVDETPVSPREWDNLGKLFIQSRRDGNTNEGDIEVTSEDFNSSEEFQTYLENKYNAIVLPIYKYEHGSVLYNTTGFSCPWDSGQVGFIFVERETVRKEYGVKRISKKLKESVEKTLVYEIEVLSQWSSGEVYGYVLEDHDGEYIDSCWGFFGNDFKSNGLLDNAPIKEFQEVA